MSVHARVFGLTDLGQLRVENEDACLAAFLENPSASVNATSGTLGGDATRQGLVLGAFDGVGGRSSGRFASDLAARVTLETLSREFATHGAAVEEWASCLCVAVQRASREIFLESTNTPARRGMGCTATVATLCGSTLLVAQVGDTRGYLLRNRELVQVTTDHTLLNAFIAAGKLTSAQEIADFEPKHVVLRAMGLGTDVSVDLVRVELLQADVILLCSDGLSSVVPESMIRELLLESSDPQATCKALIAAGNEAGAPDNIAVVIVHLEGDLPPAHS